ncbi:MAG: glycogen debranching protein [Leptolyngbyaceae cyanobacterium T60_A2020_046]|nr:glycogen debranching protein [Leptolyngbyaceae cyanobacterium T60_A2020_046]
MSDRQIWVNEQIDPCGLVYSCIACCDEQKAQLCHASFQENLTEAQKQAGWVARIRTVATWEEVPVNALKLD